MSNVRTTTYKVKLKRRATESYTKTLPTRTNKTTKIIVGDTSTVTRTTREGIIEKESVVAGQKYKTITKAVTTISYKDTTTANPTEEEKEEDIIDISTWTGDGENPPSIENSVYEADISVYAPYIDSRIMKAWNYIKFKLFVDNSMLSYLGYTNAKLRSIIIQQDDGTRVYHELGHFLAFVANNFDRSSYFAYTNSNYNWRGGWTERTLYTGDCLESSVSTSTITSSASEYFAESFREYCLIPATLKANRPLTYYGIKYCLDTLTDTQLAKIVKIYSAFWEDDNYYYNP